MRANYANQDDLSNPQIAPKVLHFIWVGGNVPSGEDDATNTFTP